MSITLTETTISHRISASPRLAIMLPLCGLIFLIGTETFLISPLLPTIAGEFNISLDRVAEIVTIYVLIYAVTAPLFGALADTTGRRIFIVVGCIVFCIGNTFSAMATMLWIQAVGRGITGLGAAMCGPAIWAYLSDNSHPDIRGRIMGIGMASFSLGQVVGVPVGALISSELGWRWAFWLISILALLLLPAFFLLLREKPREQQSKLGNSIDNVLGIWRNPSVSLALGATFFWAAVNLGTYTYLGGFLHQRYGLSVEGLGAIGIVVGFGSFIGALIGGKLVDFWRGLGRAEEVLVGIWALLLGGGVYGVLMVDNFPAAIIFLALWFVASGAFVTTQQTLLSILAPEQRGSSLSWNNSIMYAGTALGVCLLGAIMDRGYEIGILELTFTVLAITCVIFLSYYRRKITGVEHHG